MEFSDKCKVVLNDDSLQMGKISLLETMYTNKVPNYENMLRTLKAVVKDFCNITFTRCSFYAPIFIFFTADPEDNTSKYLTALNSLNANKIYKYGTKIAVAVGEESNIEGIADIVGTKEAVISPNDLETFGRLLCFKWVEVDPLLD